MLRDENVVVGIDREPFGVAYPGRETLRRRERLVGLVRVIAPDAAARLELGAWVDAGGLRNAILRLAGVGCRGDVDVQGPISIDRERMHGMIAAQRQSGHDRHRGPIRHDRAGRKRIAQDLVIDLGVQRPVVEADAGTARAAAFHGLTEALVNVGSARPGGVLQRHEEAARMGRIVAVVAAGPRIDIDDPIRGDNHVASMADAVGEDGRAEAGR